MEKIAKKLPVVLLMLFVFSVVCATISFIGGAFIFALIHSNGLATFSGMDFVKLFISVVATILLSWVLVVKLEKRTTPRQSIPDEKVSQY